jgi:hypothetical protein
MLDLVEPVTIIVVSTGVPGSPGLDGIDTDGTPGNGKTVDEHGKIHCIHRKMQSTTNQK